MGHQMWMSPVTGYRRQGTRFESFRSIFLDNAKISTVLEPVLVVKNSDRSLSVQAALEERDFDTTCVVEENGEIVGKIEKTSLGEGIVSDFLIEIQDHEKVDENVSLVELLDTLILSNYKYVTREGKIYGIITRSDINKPIPRTYLFGVVSLVELHMNFWVNFYYPEKTWIGLLKKDRQKKLSDNINLRKNGGDYLNTIDCAQFCDKKEILRNTSDFLKQFKFSKTRYTDFMTRLEKVRNEIAHSQSSLIGEIAWDVLASNVIAAETFLIMSDEAIEQDGHERSRKYESSVLVSMPVG